LVGYDKRECQKLVNPRLLQPQLRKHIERGRFLFLVQPAVGRWMTLDAGQEQSSDCLERLISEMMYYVSSETLDLTQLLTHV